MSEDYIELRNDILSGEKAFFVDADSRHKFYSKLFRFLEENNVEDEFTKSVLSIVYINLNA